MVRGAGCTPATVRQQNGNRLVGRPAGWCTSAAVEFRILGPLEVLDGGRELALGGRRQRALLAVLLLHANETLGSERLVHELWGESPPATAVKTVQVQISRVRKALGRDLLVTREGGYRLELDPDSLDSQRFEKLLAEGRSELAGGHPEAAAAALTEALALWRGRPLEDLAYEAFAQREVARLEDLQLAAREQLVEARLALGGHAEVVGELETLIADNPYREGLRGQLMLALYRSERQAEALQAYQEARRALVEELGIEPSERLRELERAVLAQDPSLQLVEAPAAVEPPPAEPPPPEPRPEPAPGETARRLVTILFADLAGSTGLAERLDPESMHDVLDRFGDVCGDAIERHGGSVEKFIGDAVVGTFGLGEIHEDDALRAVRAALEMREAARELSERLARERGVEIGLKVAVETGEVFLGAGARRTAFAAGDAYNVASRLQGQAGEGEILLGEQVQRLVAGAVRVERLERLALRGRSAPVQAWRLLELTAEQAFPAGPASPFVGREGELDSLRAACARAESERTLRALTVVGPAGIGKSRLVGELLGGVGPSATVAIGRCAPYGLGVTYRPLAQIVRALAGEEPRARLEQLLGGHAPSVRALLATLGLSSAAVAPEEVSSAVRRLLEKVAEERLLLVVIEDLHWAEPALLDLLEYLCAFSSGHPILLLCNTRPELVESVRPGWALPLPNRELLRLDALAEADAHRLVAAAAGLGPSAAERIVATGDGNPLFLEQLAAVQAEHGGAALPVTLHGVLAARIDRLDPEERAVLQHAAVQGRSFYVEPLESVVGGASRQLVSLVQGQLVRADSSDLPGQDAFRFSHALIREAAYGSLPRQRRAEVHELVARWLDERPGVRDEQVGFHLAEAYLQQAGLGPVGEAARALAAAAAERLARAAEATLLLGDSAGAVSLLERAESVMEHGDPARSQILLRLGTALLEAGRLEDAERVLTELVESTQDDPWLRSRARVERLLVRVQESSGAASEDEGRTADEGLRLAAEHGDELGQCRALHLRACQAWQTGSIADADEAWRGAAEHAERAGDEAALFTILDWRAAVALFGPTPVPEAIARCHEMRERMAASPVAVARTSPALGGLHAMAGDFDEGRRLVHESDEVLAEHGGLYGASQQQEAYVDMVAGRPEEAEARLRLGYERLEEMGEKSLLSSTAAMLAQTLYAQSRFEEADEACRWCEEAALDDDVSIQIDRRAIRAKLLAVAGKAAEAELLAREAVEIAARTDYVTDRANALCDLAEVLERAGKPDEAEAAAGRGRRALPAQGQRGGGRPGG